MRAKTDPTFYRNPGEAAHQLVERGAGTRSGTPPRSA
jgi:hypothetical protein